MAERDYIIPEILLKKEAIINIKDLYSLIKEWVVNRGYDLLEKEHHAKSKEESKDLEIKLVAEKKVDDYTKFMIEVKIKGNNLREVILKKKKAIKGLISIKLESYLEKDYEDVWEVKPLPKFFRGLYDKFVLKNKFDKYSDELKKETYMLGDEIKAFLNLHKFE